MPTADDRAIAVSVLNEALGDENLEEIRKSLKKKLRSKLPGWLPIGRILRYVLPALRDELVEVIGDGGE